MDRRPTARSAPATSGAASPGKLAVIFPGQGSQYVGHAPRSRVPVPGIPGDAHRSRRGIRSVGPRLAAFSDRIYPISTFTGEALRGRREAR